MKKSIPVLIGLFFLSSISFAETWTNDKVLNELHEREIDAPGYVSNADIRGENKSSEIAFKNNGGDTTTSVKSWLIRHGGLHHVKKEQIAKIEAEKPKIDILPAGTSNDTRLSNCVASIRKTKDYRSAAEWTQGKSNPKLHDIYYQKLDQCMEDARTRDEAKEKQYNSYNEYVKNLLYEPGSQQ